MFIISMENVHFCCFYCLLNFTSLLSVDLIKPISLISKPVQFITYIFDVNFTYHLLTYRQCIFYFEREKKRKKNEGENLYKQNVMWRAYERNVLPPRNTVKEISKKWTSLSRITITRQMKRFPEREVDSRVSFENRCSR